MKYSFLLFGVLLFFMTWSCSKQGKHIIIGVKIYEYSEDFKQLVDKWKEMGINTAFMSEELAARADFRKRLKENGIDVFVIFPVFYDPESLKRDSLLYAVTNSGKRAVDDWVEFVCPSRKAYRNKKINEAIEMVSRLKPEGLSIDFIRHFVFWEMIYPDRDPASIESACFCDSCVSCFCTLRNLQLPDSVKQGEDRSKYITENYKPEWEDYRTTLISEMVREIAEKTRLARPGLKINVHAVPWRDNDFSGANIRIAGQDLSKIEPYADYISPMCYSQMLKRDAAWISSVVEEMDKKAPGKILPSIQVSEYYIDNSFTPENFGQCLDSALASPSLGVVFFSWPLFEKDTSKIETVVCRMERFGTNN